MELKALSVESKLLFRDLQSQSQVLYVLVMVLAMQLFPGRGGATVDDWWFPLIPFFFLAMGGSYASWSLKNMPQTAQMLRQFPCDPARVRRGKAFFYGLIQSVCIALLVGVLRVLGRFTVGNLPVLGILWIALSFATSATTVTAAAYKPLIPQATGIPRLDLGVGIALFLVNGALAAISGVTYMLGAVRSLNYPSALWNYACLAVVANAVVFVVATNMAGKMIRAPRRRKAGGGGLEVRICPLFFHRLTKFKRPRAEAPDRRRSPWETPCTGTPRDGPPVSSLRKGLGKHGVGITVRRNRRMSSRWAMNTA